ncbi:hypothetical protein PFISCL1PPCAC_8779, partial [Pristionchus fissidentatus]
CFVVMRPFYERQLETCMASERAATSNTAPLRTTTAFTTRSNSLTEDSSQYESEHEEEEEGTTVLPDVDGIPMMSIIDPSSAHYLNPLKKNITHEEQREMVRERIKHLTAYMKAKKIPIDDPPAVPPLNTVLSSLTSCMPKASVAPNTPFLDWFLSTAPSSTTTYPSPPPTAPAPAPAQATTAPKSPTVGAYLYTPPSTTPPQPTVTPPPAAQRADTVPAPTVCTPPPTGLAALYGLDAFPQGIPYPDGVADTVAEEEEMDMDCCDRVKTPLMAGPMPPIFDGDDFAAATAAAEERLAAARVAAAAILGARPDLLQQTPRRMQPKRPSEWIDFKQKAAAKRAAGTVEESPEAMDQSTVEELITVDVPPAPPASTVVVVGQPRTGPAPNAASWIEKTAAKSKARKLAGAEKKNVGAASAAAEAAAQARPAATAAVPRESAAIPTAAAAVAEQPTKQRRKAAAPSRVNHLSLPYWKEEATSEQRKKKEKRE